jgi:hypothetical protein
MVNKTDFSQEEWYQIMTSPQVASFYVALASPSGPIGAIQEMMAFGKLIVEGLKVDSGNALIEAVVSEFKARAEKREMIESMKMSKDVDEMKATCLKLLRDLDLLLSSKAPAEADGFKRWVYQSAQRSAEAAKEGGFMGFGGEKVNEEEVEALREISRALGI